MQSYSLSASSPLSRTMSCFSSHSERGTPDRRGAGPPLTVNAIRTPTTIYTSEHSYRRTPPPPRPSREQPSGSSVGGAYSLHNSDGDSPFPLLHSPCLQGEAHAGGYFSHSSNHSDTSRRGRQQHHHNHQPRSRLDGDHAMSWLSPHCLTAQGELPLPPSSSAAPPIVLHGCHSEDNIIAKAAVSQRTLPHLDSAAMGTPPGPSTPSPPPVLHQRLSEECACCGDSVSPHTPRSARTPQSRDRASRGQPRAFPSESEPASSGFVTPKQNGHKSTGPTVPPSMDNSAPFAQLVSPVEMVVGIEDGLEGDLQATPGFDAAYSLFMPGEECTSAMNSIDRRGSRTVSHLPAPQHQRMAAMPSAPSAARRGLFDSFPSLGTVTVSSLPHLTRTLPYGAPLPPPLPQEQPEMETQVFRSGQFRPHTLLSTSAAATGGGGGGSRGSSAAVLPRLPLVPPSPSTAANASDLRNTSEHHHAVPSASSSSGHLMERLISPVPEDVGNRSLCSDGWRSPLPNSPSPSLTSPPLHACSQGHQWQPHVMAETAAAFSYASPVVPSPVPFIMSTEPAASTSTAPTTAWPADISYATPTQSPLRDGDGSGRRDAGGFVSRGTSAGDGPPHLTLTPSRTSGSPARSSPHTPLENIFPTAPYTPAGQALGETTPRMVRQYTPGFVVSQPVTPQKSARRPGHTAVSPPLSFTSKVYNMSMESRQHAYSQQLDATTRSLSVPPANPYQQHQQQPKQYVDYLPPSRNPYSYYRGLQGAVELGALVVPEMDVISGGGGEERDAHNDGATKAWRPLRPHAAVVLYEQTIPPSASYTASMRPGRLSRSRPPSQRVAAPSATPKTSASSHPHSPSTTSHRSATQTVEEAAVNTSREDGGDTADSGENGAGGYRGLSPQRSPQICARSPPSRRPQPSRYSPSHSHHVQPNESASAAERDGPPLPPRPLQDSAPPLPPPRRSRDDTTTGEGSDADVTCSPCSTVKATVNSTSLLLLSSPEGDVPGVSVSPQLTPSQSRPHPHGSTGPTPSSTAVVLSEVRSAGNEVHSASPCMDASASGSSVKQLFASFLGAAEDENSGSGGARGLYGAQSKQTMNGDAQKEAKAAGDGSAPPSPDPRPLPSIPRPPALPATLSSVPLSQSLPRRRSATGLPFVYHADPARCLELDEVGSGHGAMGDSKDKSTSSFSTHTPNELLATLQRGASPLRATVSGEGACWLRTTQSLNGPLLPPGGTAGARLACGGGGGGGAATVPSAPLSVAVEAVKKNLSHRLVEEDEEDKGTHDPVWSATKQSEQLSEVDQQHQQEEKEEEAFAAQLQHSLHQLRTSQLQAAGAVKTQEERLSDKAGFFSSPEDNLRLPFSIQQARHSHNGSRARCSSGTPHPPTPTVAEEDDSVEEGNEGAPLFPLIGRHPSLGAIAKEEEEEGSLSGASSTSVNEMEGIALVNTMREDAEEEEEELEEDPGDRFLRHHRFQFAHHIPPVARTATPSQPSSFFLPIGIDINGVVWLATHRLDGMPYAVKEIPDGHLPQLKEELACLTLGNDPCNRLQRQAGLFLARYLSCTRFPCAAALTVSGRLSDQSANESVIRQLASHTHAYLVQTEYFPFGTVWEDVVGALSPVSSSSQASSSWRRAKTWETLLQHALRGLEALHAYHLVHGNPLPHNLFISGPEHFRLGNFGAARCEPAEYPAVAPAFLRPQNPMTPYETDVFVLCSGLLYLLAVSCGTQSGAKVHEHGNEEDGTRLAMETYRRRDALDDFAEHFGAEGQHGHEDGLKDLRNFVQLLQGARSSPLSAAALLHRLQAVDLETFTACQLYDAELFRLSCKYAALSRKKAERTSGVASELTRTPAKKAMDTTHSSGVAPQSLSLDHSLRSPASLFLPPPTSTMSILVHHTDSNGGGRQNSMGATAAFAQRPLPTSFSHPSLHSSAAATSGAGAAYAAAKTSSTCPHSVGPAPLAWSPGLAPTTTSSTAALCSHSPSPALRASRAAPLVTLTSRDSFNDSLVSTPKPLMAVSTAAAVRRTTSTRLTNSIFCHPTTTEELTGTPFTFHLPPSRGTGAGGLSEAHSSVYAVAAAAVAAATEGRQSSLLSSSARVTAATAAAAAFNSSFYSFVAGGYYRDSEVRPAIRGMVEHCVRDAFQLPCEGGAASNSTTSTSSSSSNRDVRKHAEPSVAPALSTVQQIMWLMGWTTVKEGLPWSSACEQRKLSPAVAEASKVSSAQDDTTGRSLLTVGSVNRELVEILGDLRPLTSFE